MVKFDTNFFSLDYYGRILQSAQEHGYTAYTMEDFWHCERPPTHALVLRHDVDVRPHTLKQMLDVERKHRVRSTLYVRVAGAPYNFLDYSTYKVLKDAEAAGFRIGLHTNYLEFATINGRDPFRVLCAERAALVDHFDAHVVSVAPHRDQNYVVNSLPHLEQNWEQIKLDIGFKFHAYDKQLLGAVEYVNEGWELHLKWRNKSPEDVIPTGKSFVMMTHSHWWYKDHPFEQ
jgi:hypothetical protein